VPKRARTPTNRRKRDARSAGRKRRGREDDSDSDDSAPAARNRGGKERGGRTGRARGDGSASRARGKSRGKTNASDDSDGAGARPLLPAGSRSAAAKYLSILASNMPDASKTNVIETMVLAEADRSLKTFINDHMEEQVSLEHLACMLQEDYEDE